MLAKVDTEITTDEKFLTHRSASTRPRHFYNTHTKQCNALLKTFPSNIVGSILGYDQEPLIYMTSKEKAGTSSDVTW